MKLKLMGYWSNGDDNRAYPDPRDLVDPLWHPDIRWKIGQYLLNGAVFSRSWGYSYCRFQDGPPPEEMGSKELTDGVFVWPEALHLYVSRYNVVLPEEFLEHVRSNNFKVPENLQIVPIQFLAHLKRNEASERSKLEGAEIDHDYWIRWSTDYIKLTKSK